MAAHIRRTRTIGARFMMEALMTPPLPPSFDSGYTVPWS